MLIPLSYAKVPEGPEDETRVAGALALGESTSIKLTTVGMVRLPDTWFRHTERRLGRRSVSLRGALSRRLITASMPSLRALLERHESLLVIDSASSRIHVGWLQQHTDAQWQYSDEEAGIGIFRAFAALSVDPQRAHAFVFCEGPGSILGIRTAATALRTWSVLQPRPAYAYCSLELVAAARPDSKAAIIADARRESWHVFQPSTGLRRIPTAELRGELLMPAEFRHWSALPSGVQSVPYAVADLWRAAAEADLLREAPAPDAFLHEEPSYVTWTPQIHRAPA